MHASQCAIITPSFLHIFKNLLVVCMQKKSTWKKQIQALLCSISFSERKASLARSSSCASPLPQSPYFSILSSFQVKPILSPLLASPPLFICLSLLTHSSLLPFEIALSGVPLCLFSLFLCPHLSVT